MNRTPEYRECVVKTRTSGDYPAPEIFPKTPTPLPFTTAASGLLDSIQKMRSLILSQKMDYLNLDDHMASQRSRMTDEERDLLEAEVTLFARKQSKEIQALQATLGDKDSHPGDLPTHQRRVVGLLVLALKELTQGMQAMQAVRTERVRRSNANAGLRRGSALKELLAGGGSRSRSPAKRRRGGENDDGSGIGGGGGGGGLLNAAWDDDSDEDDGLDGVEFTEEEQAMLLEENNAILEELEDNLEKLRQSERKMTQIGAELTLFSTMVLEQEETIGTIHDAAITSVSHVKLGNQQLRQASKRGVDFRLSVLFVLVMASLSLLFLDWYMP